MTKRFITLGISSARGESTHPHSFQLFPHIKDILVGSVLAKKQKVKESSLTRIFFKVVNFILLTDMTIMQHQEYVYICTSGGQKEVLFEPR